MFTASQSLHLALTIAGERRVADGYGHAYSLCKVAQALARGNKEESLELADKVLRAAAGLRDARQKADVLSRVAHVLSLSGEAERAVAVLAEALESSRMGGRASVFLVLQRGREVYRLLGRGEALPDIFEAVLEVERWWLEPESLLSESVIFERLDLDPTLRPEPEPRPARKEDAGKGLQGLPLPKSSLPR